MTTVVLGEQPEITEWLDRRRALGLDGHDEVWEGVPHVAPHSSTAHAAVAAEIMAVLRPYARAAGLRSLAEFNRGVKDDYRVPDGGWVRSGTPSVLHVPTAVAVLEVVSPDDETYAKLPFSWAHDVREVLIAHPTERWVRCWTPRSGSAHEVRSDVFGVSTVDVEAQIDWP